jgi:hypothetical protein
MQVMIAVVGAATIMIGEKAAELIASDHDVQLSEFVGAAPH